MGTTPSQPVDPTGECEACGKQAPRLHRTIWPTASLCTSCVSMPLHEVVMAMLERGICVHPDRFPSFSCLWE